jgi:hypothetical protein
MMVAGVDAGLACKTFAGWTIFAGYPNYKKIRKFARLTI